MKKLDIALPVLNEESILKKNVMFLYEFLDKNLSDIEWKIIIVDNGSSDSTQSLGEYLSKEKPNIEYIRLEERGRGRALKKAWSKSKADFVSYMDIDLSTDLSHFLELVSQVNLVMRFLLIPMTVKLFGMLLQKLVKNLIYAH